MEAIIMDLNYQTLAIVDSFKSFIWTERYNSYGDFELTLVADSPYLQYLTIDNYIYRKGSDRLMVIDYVQVSTDKQKGNTAIIKGSSLEKILDRRIIWDSTTFAGNFEDCILRMLKNNIITPSDTNRTIPHFFYKDSGDDSIKALSLNMTLYGENLYDTIASECQSNNIGFKVCPNFDTQPGGFIFSLYRGVDRSYRQEDNPWIVFSPQFENLCNSNYILSRNDLKTVVLVTVSGDEPDRLRKEITSDSQNFYGLSRREEFKSSSVRDVTTASEVNKDDFGTAEDRVNIDDYGYTETDEDFNASAYKYAIAQGYRPTEQDFTRYTTREIAPEEDPAYKAALEQAQADIDAEYEAAVESAKQQAAEDRVAVQNELEQVGKEVLEEHKVSQAFDGEVEANWQWQANKDFFLGDVVQIKNEYGMEAVSRITELIYSEDANGFSIIPTFTTV